MQLLLALGLAAGSEVRMAAAVVMVEQQFQHQGEQPAHLLQDKTIASLYSCYTAGIGHAIQLE